MLLSHWILTEAFEPYIENKKPNWYDDLKWINL